MIHKPAPYTKDTMVFCSECGMKCDSLDKFCFVCGSKLKEATTTKPGPSVPSITVNHPVQPTNDQETLVVYKVPEVLPTPEEPKVVIPSTEDSVSTPKLEKKAGFTFWKKR